jgi:Holliday junction resolvase RusA-like endonuclease
MGKQRREWKITVLGTPKPKQSFKYNSVTGAKYTPEEVLQIESNYRTQIVQQLPKGWIPLKGAVAIGMLYVFQPPKSLSKKLLKVIEEGGKVYKTTKPDLSDNLNKGVMDSVRSILFYDDAQICKVIGMEKIYGLQPRTELTIIDLEE